MKRSGSVLFGLGIAVGLLLFSFPSRAQVVLSETGQPESYVLSFSQADLRGFGQVTFDMTVDEVEAAVATMFPEAGIERTLEPVQQTRILHLTVPQLAPVSSAPSQGPASLTYVFGARSERLMAININWYTDGDATPSQQDALLAVGTAYVADLLGYIWEPFSTSRGVVVGPNAVILFAGRDQAGHGVEVIVEGVPLDVVVLPSGEMEHRPVVTGPAHLRMRLAAQPDNPDVFTIPAGSF